MRAFRVTLVIVLIALFQIGFAQTKMQYYRSVSKSGINTFETSKENNIAYDGFKVKLGGDFAIQFQALSQENDLTTMTDTLIELSNNFNLPTANFSIDAQLEKGLRVHLKTYLSSKHHEEAWVKGGHLQIDNLDFIKEGFLTEFMDMATIRFGMDEINYGDTHFRRSDNASTFFNPFVGNYIMDSFTTEPFGELTIQKDGFLGVAGLSNGRLNQRPLPGDDGVVFFGKLGYDNYVNEDLRLRLTGSIYSSSKKGTRDYLYGGDRSGSRYYRVLEFENGGGSDFDPRLNPRYAYQTALQVNPFIEYKGLEFFGVFEKVTNGDDAVGGDLTQIGADLLYRFGKNDNLYVGGRYNGVTGNITDASSDLNINRLNFGGGLFLTENIVMKLEVVKQEYKDPFFSGTELQGAQFDGAILEAAISF